MITRFYVDNYKSLVNFEYKPSSFELILGANGSGKSTVFEALMALKEFILNQKTVEQAFPDSTLTRWQSRDEMRFEIEIMDQENSHKYELTLELDGFVGSIQSEILWRNGKKIVESNFKREVSEDEDGNKSLTSFLDVTVYRNDKTNLYRAPDYEKSSIGQFGFTFRDAISRLLFLRMQPNLMIATVLKSESQPNRSFSNFPAYYLHLLQEKQGLVFDLLPILRENIQGFRAFALEERAKMTRQLRVEFAVEGGKGKTVRYDFDELSDGQRALIALYTVAFCEANSTLLIDEPENFISSRELQPWLMLLKERIEDFGGQTILISHHPEFINVMAPQDAIQFRRVNGGPVQIRPFETEQYEGLTPAEIVARGWENE